MLNTPPYIVNALRQGAVGVIPTDTLYGVVGSALRKDVVDRVYRLRSRDAAKPFIVLIPSIAALKAFGVELDAYHRAFLKEAWPGPISVILPVLSRKYEYLHRGTQSIAFRLPDSPSLVALLKKTGPLIASSANTEGKPPARTIKAAQKFFGPNVDFYMDGGRKAAKASTLIALTGPEPIILRK